MGTSGEQYSLYSNKPEEVKKLRLADKADTVRGKYRSEVGIVADMLCAIVDYGRCGATMSEITRAAHVSHSSASKKIQKLVDAGIVGSCNSQGCRFTITERGVAFLEQFLRFTDTIRKMNIRY